MLRAICLASFLIVAGFQAAVPSPESPDPNTPTPIAARDTIFIEEMTWMEVRDALAAGKTTVIMPTGGVEQNGPYLATGKHNYVLRATTEAIARKLGNALVAPIVAVRARRRHRPADRAHEVSRHDQPDRGDFRAAADRHLRQLRTHGFAHIVLIGDSGGNQKGMKAVAADLNAKWAGGKTRVHFIPEYYNYPGVDKWLEQPGNQARCRRGLHDDFAITAMMMTVDPTTVRMKQRDRGRQIPDQRRRPGPRRKDDRMGQEDHRISRQRDRQGDQEEPLRRSATRKSQRPL